ncbi:hypothetical protein CK203_107010 [Vitis vinifera]|uniref:Uncharacterized protein n=1 Tax=Vitis vinifera TaxID=29760 RepID=A0A438ERP3_VITVI|nr:hypothetical protein CK203_107010 [Vitis vinifera]
MFNNRSPPLGHNLLKNRLSSRLTIPTSPYILGNHGRHIQTDLHDPGRECIEHWVVSNKEVAKECLAINDSAVSGHPKLVAPKHLGYNYAMLALYIYIYIYIYK